jgi:hypothetical protein
MWLDVAEVLLALHGHQRVFLEMFSAKGYNIGDGKCIPVDEDKPVGIIP